jgi:hypothetical protein
VGGTIFGGRLIDTAPLEASLEPPEGDSAAPAKIRPG